MLLSIHANNLIILCIGITIIALFFAIYIIVDLIFHKEKNEKKSVQNDTLNNLENKDDGIKYVEEDSELEKTKAKLELASLKEKLLLESQNENIEQKDNIVIEINDDKEQTELLDTSQNYQKEEYEITSNSIDNGKLSNQIVLEEEKKEELPNTVLKTEEEKKEKKESVSTIREDVKTIDEREKLIREKLEKSFNIKKEEEVSLKIEYNENNSSNDEEDAIISYEELKKAAMLGIGYTDEEMNNYVDEKDAIISISELEKMYKEVLEINEDKQVKQDDLQNNVYTYKPVKDSSLIKEGTKLKSSPVISPVYGIQEENLNEDNLVKLNDEIKKTNEFLKALKDLKKKLE